MHSAAPEPAEIVVTRCVAPVDIERLQEALDPLRSVTGVPPRDLILFETALVEIIGNIVQTGEGSTMFDAVVTVRLWPGDRLEAELRDNGTPADVDLHRPLPDAMQEHGRGLPLARSALDELRYDPGDPNRWLLVRRLRQGT
ncbi:putative anti-sigma regulatory factor, serine/threonine protein kinase [Cellulomonas flavigena DSM 20109]|uniref:Putative anti-sigma regulatory factor, serine/threonine protein kinase n=1 Tax=Cellulomonas flavigena (strain ATCC 482 / DSM 20109 / BCRC 11376 / JCM 18109 / NBRC 3775 / NCIMB 8073 / NRS 134) TaxID=446466 RepID=D5UIT9_CELFN|nr:ATP-binding protein [Cellulomonas flavigena]ADG75505.1 putative anti-sigma regulatory factor, serine/threonine protein kinase [Cellulomonas flavigena DSM 20109]